MAIDRALSSILSEIQCDWYCGFTRVVQFRPCCQV